MPAHDIFAVAAYVAAMAAAIASAVFLRTLNFKFDATAVATTEVGLAFQAAYLVTGAIRDHESAGAWWTWNAHLTAALVCWLTYAAYLMLRQAVEEPTQRARFAAVVSIFAFADIPIVIYAVGLWRRPPAFWTDDRAGMLGAMLALGLLLGIARFRQEEMRREIDSLRRGAHTI